MLCSLSPVLVTLPVCPQMLCVAPLSRDSDSHIPPAGAELQTFSKAILWMHQAALPQAVTKGKHSEALSRAALLQVAPEA